MKKLFFVTAAAIAFSNCSSFKDRSNFSSGNYRSRGERFYIKNDNEIIRAYSLSKGKADTASFIEFPSESTDSSGIKNKTFTQESFDIDILSIPFKYRPPSKGFPNQMNTNFNGAAYFGIRQDHYHIRYSVNPLHQSERKLTHLGYSFGFFSGLGSTAMNPWVTRYSIDSEYDGVVWSNGVALILGVSRFSFGATLGVDRLLDRNSKYWIYQNRHWMGLAVTLNLN